MTEMLDIYLLSGGFIDRFINWIIDYGGFYILLLVVFAETGLFIGFFFPGDSLLFAAGVYMNKLANELFNTNIPENELWGGVPARKIKDLVLESSSSSYR